MQSLLATVQIVGLFLTIPTSLVAYTDWRHRRVLVAHAVPTSHPTGVSVGSRWAPPSVNPTATRPATPAASATIGTRVSFPRRVLSMLIDTYAWSIAAVLVGAVLSGGESLATDVWTGADTTGSVLTAVAFIAIASSTGRSLGKLIVGARLISGDDRPLSFWRVAWRSVLGALLSFLWITYFVALGNDERRALHDRLTTTRVVRTR